MTGEEYEVGTDPQDGEIEEDFAMEEQQDRQQDVYEDMTPQYGNKDDLYSLFWKVVKTNRSNKVGNLDGKELGMLNISVRDCQRISLLGFTLGHVQFARFFELMSEIILSTSASKKGWLAELFVSQRKFSSRVKGIPQQPRLGLPQEPPKKKSGLFGGRK